MNMSWLTGFLFSLILLPGPTRGIPPPAGRPGFVKFLNGAGNLQELGNALFQALKANNAEELNNFFLTENGKTVLFRTGSEDMRAVLENTSVLQLRAQFKQDFQNLIQQGVARTLPWSDLSLTETRPGRPAPKNRMLVPVTLNLQTRQNQAVVILFEAVKIRNRYFLFRGIKLANE